MPFINTDNPLLNQVSGFPNVLEGEQFMRAFIPMVDFTPPGAFIASMNWSVAPALPMGLNIDPMSGTISGKVNIMFNNIPQAPALLPTDFGTLEKLPENGGEVEKGGALKKDKVDFKITVTHTYQYTDPSSGAPMVTSDVGNFTITVLRNNAVGNYLWLKQYYNSGWKVDDYKTPDEVTPNYPSNTFVKG